MVWLPDGEFFLKICLFVSMEYKNVTDGRRTTAQAVFMHSITWQKLTS